MIIDIDHFKRFNDTFGHAAGDEVLRSVAKFMLTLVRGEDILCRFGGEEFVLAQVKASAEAIMQRAEKFRREIGNHEIVDNGRRLGAVTLSIGISMFPDHGNSAQAVLQAADTALYRAKNFRSQLRGHDAPRGGDGARRSGDRGIYPKEGLIQVITAGSAFTTHRLSHITCHPRSA
jgi:diguanylate cyclase (GGDEF)-like protein